MKFREIFRFEFTYQVSQAWPWLIFIVIVTLNFLMARDGSLSEVLYADFFLNSPFSIAKTTVFGSLLWLVMAAAIAGDAGARDVSTRIYPLTFTAPISKTEYLGGKFMAAMALNALLLLSIPAGIFLGVYLPGVDAELIGPFRPAAYLTAYAFIALPNAFAATAIQFLMAARTGRPMASYFGSFLIVFMGFFVASVLLFKRGLGTLLDPVGIRFIVEDVAHLWTTVEKNWRLLELEGIILENRLLWVGIGLLTLAFTYLSFRFTHRVASGPFQRLRSRIFRLSVIKRGSVNLNPPESALDTPNTCYYNLNTEINFTHLSSTISSEIHGAKTFGFTTHALQALAIAWTSFKAIATSRAGLALLIVIPLLTIPVVLDQMISEGVSLVPKTVLVVRQLTASLSDEFSRWVIIPFLIVFFAGELVWRERDAGLGEITDTMPGSEWGPFLGKFLGLTLMLVVYLIALTGAGLIAQMILGYSDFEIVLYLKIMLGLQLPEYLLFALLALVLHVLVDHKYIGHLVAIMAFVLIALASLFGIEHNLLIYGAAPGWSYTEMRGFGESLGPWLWFKLYWAAWTLLLAVFARLFWVRGKESSLKIRLQLASLRFTGPTTLTAAVAIVLIISLGGFIFYNTNILNDYLSSSDVKDRSAKYERIYGRYADIPQPRMTGVKLHVEIYPDRNKAEILGAYRLVNRSGAAIDSIIIALEPGIETRTLTFDRPATLIVNDLELSHRIYTLKKPLLPNDSLRLEFLVHKAPKGFRENGIDDAIVPNGTSFSNGWLPRIGYQSSRELISAGDRRAYGLAARPLIASLYDADARKSQGAGVSFEATVGTSNDQVAVAPGALRRSWSQTSSTGSQIRRYFHYSTDAAIGSEWVFFSAKYSVHETLWNPAEDLSEQGAVAIKVFHHPGHRANLDRIVKGIRASLDYYTRTFGPYPHSYINFVERAANGTGMHADPGMITFTEGTSYWSEHEDPASLDLPFAVVAHEMAHQWTVPYAAVEGAPVMSESLAWYYAMKVVEEARGPEQLRQLLHFMRQPHPIAPIRRGEPLLRGLDKYLSYRRGPFALHTLNRYVGETRVNTALRNLLEKHHSPDAPLATTLDLYAKLQAVTPDSLQYLLHDLFKVNTYWDLQTEKFTIKQIGAGDWQVTLDVKASKAVFDSAGVETAKPMDEWVEVGVFGPAKGGGQKELYLKKHRIRSGSQTINLTVPVKPNQAGIDPNFLLIDLNTDNNNRKLD